jgi:hypothetical protein
VFDHSLRQKISPEEVQNLLELESLPAPTAKKKKPESKAKLGKRNIKNNPATLGEKKVKLPPTSFRRPGLILPKQCKKIVLKPPSESTVFIQLPCPTQILLTPLNPWHDFN